MGAIPIFIHFFVPSFQLVCFGQTISTLFFDLRNFCNQLIWLFCYLGLKWGGIQTFMHFFLLSFQFVFFGQTISSSLLFVNVLAWSSLQRHFSLKMCTSLLFEIPWTYFLVFLSLCLPLHLHLFPLLLLFGFI